MNLIAKIIVLILLAGLVFLFIRLGDLTFSDCGGYIRIFYISFYILFGIISSISFLLGYFWNGIFRSWNLSNFIHRVENEETLDYISMLVKRKKKFFEDRGKEKKK
jgi:hypothetical protein